MSKHNGAQSLRFEKGATDFKSYFEQIPVPFKFYADFESNLESVESYEGSCSNKYHDHIPCSFAYKLVCVDDKISKLIVAFGGENAAFKFIEEFLTEYECCKKIMKKDFNKTLIMTEEEEQFQSSNTCWICKKLIDDDDERSEIIVT